MYKDFIYKNGIFILNDIFKDYLWTQFFPSKFLCNDDVYDKNRIIDIYDKWFNLNKINNLYIHIPFCKTRCYYCHCFTYVWDNFANTYDKYIDYLIKNINIIIWDNNNIKLNSIYLWGGTPNIVGHRNLDKLFNFIYKKFDVSNMKQFNIDLNPYLIDENTINVLAKYWVNRVTYAIQSFDKKVLDMNSRYNFSKINHKKNINLLHDFNIKVNIDLMVWIKWQTFDICKNDILKSIELNADNISLNYFIQSENVSYKIDNEKKVMMSQVKKYFNKIINYKYNNSYNEQEETYLKSNINLIWIWNWAITHLNWLLIWYNNYKINKYYEKIDSWILFSNIKFLNKQIELIKYLFYNLVFEIDIDYIYNNFWWFNWLDDKIDFLISNKIINNNWKKFSPNVNNFKLYLYLTILLYDYVDNEKYQYTETNKSKVVFNLKKFFLENWEKVDEDY